MQKKLYLLISLTFLFFSQYGYSQATCATAVPVTVGTQQCGSSQGQVGDFPNGGSAPTNPCVASYNDDEYWFSIVGDGTNAIQVDLTSITATYAGVFIIDDCPANTPNCVTSVDNGSSTADLSVATTNALTSGVTYYIVIANWGAPDFTDFCLDVALVAPLPPLANDSCQIADVLPVQQDACTTWTLGDNTLATDSGELPAPSCGSYSGGDMWYNVTVPASGNVTFDVQNVSWTSVAASLYSGTCGALAEEDCTEFGTGWPFVFTGLTAGDYLLRVWDYSNDQTGTFEICAFTTACSITELAAGAQTACDPVDNTYTQEIIVTYTDAPATGTLDVNGQSFPITSSPQTVVLTGLPSNGATVDANVNFSGSTTCALDSLDLFTAPAICLTTPANDSCGAPTMAMVNATDSCGVVTGGITTAASESLPTCLTFGSSSVDVWFEFVATNVEHNFEILNISPITGTSTDMVHEVFSGTCGTLTSLGCSDPNTSTVSGLTVGSTYLVRVYSYFASSTQAFDLCITTPPPPPPPPANDTCGMAEVLPIQADACTTWTVGDNTGATDSGEGTPSCGSYNGGDMWFEVTVPASGNVTFDVQNVSWTSVAAALYSGTCGALTEVDCTEFGSGWPFVFTGLTPGTYYLRTWDYSNDQVGTYEICGFTTACSITELAAGAQTACDPVTNTYTQEIIVTYVDEPATGTLDVNGQSFPITASPQTIVLTGLTSDGATVDANASFSDATTCALDSLDLFTAPVSCIPAPPNDSCGTPTMAMVNATDTCAVVTPGTTEGATESLPTCLGFGSSSDDVWFSFVATNIEHDFEILNITPTTGTSTDMVHEVFSGACGTLTSLGCSDPNTSSITGLTVGSTYLVRVYSYFATSDQSFDLCITTPPPPPPPPANDTCAIAEVLPVQADSCTTWTVGDNTGATDSGVPDPSCSTYSGGDIWYEVTVPASGSVSFDVQNVTWSNASSALYSGTCGGLTEVGCTGFNTAYPAAYTGLTPGTYYLRVWDFSNNDVGTFELCAYEPAPCAIDELSLGIQTACDTLNGTYTQEVIVVYSGASSGTLDVNGQTAPITTSPQTITLTGLLADGMPVTAIATITGDNVCTFTATDLFTAPAACYTFPTESCDAYTSSPGAIIDDTNDPSDVITVTGTGMEITDLNVVLKIDHSFLGDLDVTLTSPTGVVVDLTLDNCGSNENLEIEFDDEAAGAITCGTPTVGVFTPDGSLSDFDGELFDGNWTLNVVDDFTGDNGVLIQWCLIPELGMPTTCNLFVFTDTDEVSCQGTSDGAATASPSFGVMPYTYQWDAAAASQTTAMASDLAVGQYLVTVTDAIGCTEVAGVIIEEAPCDYCELADLNNTDICVVINADPSDPLANLDCDGDGATNGDECNDGTDPSDPCFFEGTSITEPVTADLSDCANLCQDITLTTSLVPNNIAGATPISLTINVTELNGVDAAGLLPITVRMPSDPRLTFTWNAGANPNWNYLGDNGITHTWRYIGNGGVLLGGTTSQILIALAEGMYDPQGTSGSTTITPTVVPTSGGECNFLNNSDPETLVYFK